MKYIAYGSNMSRAQMKFRCPDAKLVGMGYIAKARYEFRGYPGNAHATLEPDRVRGRKVPVAIWELSNQDELRLDRYEGHPHYYRKEVWEATLTNGRTVNGTIYLMNGEHINLPSESYFEGIWNAYEDLGLKRHHGVLKQALEAARIWEA